MYGVLASSLADTRDHFGVMAGAWCGGPLPPARDNFFRPRFIELIERSPHVSLHQAEKDCPSFKWAIPFRRSFFSRIRDF